MATGADNTPPWDLGTGDPEQIPNGSSSPGISRLGRYLSVGHDLAAPETVDHSEHRVLEIGHTVPKSRSPMSPSPGAM